MPAEASVVTRQLPERQALTEVTQPHAGSQELTRPHCFAGLPAECRGRWESFVGETLTETNRRNTVDLVRAHRVTTWTPSLRLRPRVELGSAGPGWAVPLCQPAWEYGQAPS